jgi:cbb3-type cytochrome oxidase maturation protein
MSALYFLLPIALAMGAAFVGLFAWAVRNGQFDDLDDAPIRMLQDDEEGL